MDKVPPKPRRAKVSTRDELLKLDKNELVDRVLQLEAHNVQLKNIISKNLSNDPKEKNKQNKKPFDFSKCHYRRILLRILYLGWDYQGLAVQEDTNQTIEHHLFHALTKGCLVEAREKAQYHRCGRTDKGVSSFGQVISLTIRSNLPPEDQKSADSTSELPYCKILNRLLPKEIRAVAWVPAPEGTEFSARFDCKTRQYKYYFPRSSLDIRAMRDACSLLIGSHDFRHLCKMDVANGVTEFTREIFNAEILPVEKESEVPTSMYYLKIVGNAFLWHQIRCIMSILLLVGKGCEKPDIVGELLDVERNPRKPQYNLALDIPLNLFKCSYDMEKETEWCYDKDELRCVIVHLQSEWTVHSVKTTMIKDCLNELEGAYKNLIQKGTEGTENIGNERDSIIMAHTDCLIQGVKPRVYVPLLKRVTCSSLEERIEHYKKKRKIDSSETTA